MKKSHHVDITKAETLPNEVKKELQDFYIFLLLNQEKHTLFRIKSKTKISKMLASINTMLQNSDIKIKTYLEELKNIFAFLVSPSIEDSDIRNNAINYQFSFLALFDDFDIDYIYPITNSLFTLSGDAEKKTKGSKKIMISSLFSRYIKQMKNEEEFDKKKFWLKIIFYCIFPSLQKLKQQDSAIISECSHMCIEAINKMVSKATENNTMDYFLQEDSFFIIFESAALLKNLYSYEDRRCAIIFYSRIFPCIFYYVDLDLSVCKFEKKDDMNEILQKRRYSGWGGPNLLASFNSEPRPFFYQIINLIINRIKDSFIPLLEPMLEAMCFMLNQIKSSTNIEIDIIDLYFIIMRLRNVVKLSFKISTNILLIDTSFTCIIMYITQSNPAYKEYFPFFLSFYLTILFDSKLVNIQEAHNFVSSIINLSNITDSMKSNVMPQICVHVVAMICIALSPFLLDIPKDQSRAFLTNSMEMKISLKPLSLTLMRRITTSNIYFFLQIIGCEFSEILNQNAKPSESKDHANNPKEEAYKAIMIDNWTKEKASKFILDIIEAIDSTVGFLASATTADVLLCVLKLTSNSNANFIFEKILPILFYNALNKKPDLPVFIPVLRKLVRNAFRYGNLNKAMSHDYFRVIQKYILINGSQDIKDEMIFAAAQSIIRGFPMSLSLIPLFVVLINEIISQDTNHADDSEGKINSIAFTKHIQLICTCLVEIIIISRNNPLFSHSLSTIDESLRDTILKIFAYNEAFASSFESILLNDGGLKTKCLRLLKYICSSINPNEHKNIENLILLLLLGEVIQKNNENEEENHSIIESILTDNFLQSDRFLSLSLEFHQMLILLLQHFSAVMKKFPNLLSSVIYSVSIVFVKQKPITIDQYEFLLRFVTYLSIVTDSSMIMYQCLNIISLQITAPDKKAILDAAFDTFVYNYKKKIGVTGLKFDDLMLFINSETIYSLKFNFRNNEKNINTFAIQISNKNGSSNYILKCKNKYVKEDRSLNVNVKDSQIDNSDKSDNRKSKMNFKLLREFMLYPSTALLFEILSESNNSIIKGTSKNFDCTLVAKKAFMRDQHIFIDTGIIFIGKNQNHKKEFFMNEWKNVSSTFRAFLMSMGKLYKPSEIPFLINCSAKIRDELKNDEAVLCWSDIFHNVICSVSPLANYEDGDRKIQGWNRFKNMKFIIFWTESMTQIDFFAEGFLSEGKLEYAFIVQPYNKDTVILSVFQKRNNIQVLTFFKKSMLLPFDMIGFVIQSMIVLSFDMNNQINKKSAVVSNQLQIYKDLYENKLDDDTFMFGP